MKRSNPAKGEWAENSDGCLDLMQLTAKLHLSKQGPSVVVLEPLHGSEHHTEWTRSQQLVDFYFPENLQDVRSMLGQNLNLNLNGLTNSLSSKSFEFLFRNSRTVPAVFGRLWTHRVPALRAPPTSTVPRRRGELTRRRLTLFCQLLLLKSRMIMDAF